MRVCKKCGHSQKYLTRVWPSKCPKCLNKWQSEPRTPTKYNISYLIIGGSMMFPWDSKEMIYTTAKSQVMRACITRQAKKLGWTIDIDRHIAGLKVIRVS